MCLRFAGQQTLIIKSVRPVKKSVTQQEAQQKQQQQQQLTPLSLSANIPNFYSAHS